MLGKPTTYPKALLVGIVISVITGVILMVGNLTAVCRIGTGFSVLIALGFTQRLALAADRFRRAANRSTTQMHARIAHRASGGHAR